MENKDNRNLYVDIYIRMAIVYQHKKKDTGELFYIGIGNNKRRSTSIFKRSQLWHNTVNKHGLNVEITHSDICWEEACCIEQYLISFYGRRDLGTGILINMTDGGDGRYGAKISEETRIKMSDSHKGKPAPRKGCKNSNETREKIRQYFLIHGSPNKDRPKTEEHKRKISETLKKRGDNNWHGRKHSEESIQKMRLSHGSGENNPRYGKKHSEETIQKMRESAKKRAARQKQNSIITTIN